MVSVADVQRAIDTVDEGIELLTGIPAGERDERGQYPE